MSFWLGKDKSRISVSIPLMFPFTVVALILVTLGFRYAANIGSLAADSSFLIFAGLVALLISKASLFRRGIWWSWGCANMSPGFRWSYWAGYIFIIFGSLGLTLFMVSAGAL